MSIAANHCRRLPAEWEPQSFVQLTWPHAGTDWAPYLDEAYGCFLAIARAVASRSDLLVVACDAHAVEAQLRGAGVAMRADAGRGAVVFEAPTDDTWARDHAFITTVVGDGTAELHDFRFNGWGAKFASERDNAINGRLWSAGALGAAVYADDMDTVLEGGSIESDGRGTILTTSCCLFSPNRNGYRTKAEAEAMLRGRLGAERVLWLDHGALTGDDTDGHIDTLARLCPDGEADVPEIAALLASDPALGGQYTPEGLAEQLLERMRTGMGRSFVIRRDGRIAAHVATYAECPEFMVTSGLVVHPDYRDTPCFFWLDQWVARLAEAEGKAQYGMVLEPRLLRAFRRDRREKAAEYHIDPGRIGIWGTSSGGNTALLAGLTGDDPAYRTEEYPGQSDHVKMVVDCFGPADAAGLLAGRLEELRALPPDDYSCRQFFGLLGETEAEQKERMASIDPISKIRDRPYPPFLLVHGDRDPLVPYAQSEAMAEKLARHGVHTELVRVLGAEHEGTFWSPELFEKIAEFIRKTL